MDNIAREILQTLKKYGPMEAYIIAVVTGIEENEVNMCLHNRLRDFCVQNENNEWTIRSSASQGVQGLETNSISEEEKTDHYDEITNDGANENNATSGGQKKIDRWADKLLDTGKRNNLMNFRDTKASTAEIVFPDCEKIFSKCSIGHTFEIYDPKIQDDDIEEDNEQLTLIDTNEHLSKKEYTEQYASRIKGDKYLLAYAQTPNPLTAVKNIAKKARSMQDETGVNVAYLAFGFLKWNEKEGSEVFFRAPLLLVHINIITGSVVDPVKIEISDDDVVVNPTFNYLLQADYGLELPEYVDGESLAQYYKKVSATVGKLGWEIINECKLSIFSFLKINMYEDLKKNTDLILENENVKALMGEGGFATVGFSDYEHVVDNPLIELHTVVDADSSQIEAIEMAKSGKSFVLQGPPGTGKSQTITNIIAECLHDGKKVLFVSEKQAALNVVFDKLKKAGLADFCLELHSHKANKKAVIEELNRTLEVPKIGVSSSAQEEIRQKRSAQAQLDIYAAALHKKRDVIDKSMYQLIELHSAERSFPDLQYSIKGINSKNQNYLLKAVELLEQYVEYIPTVGQNYKDNAWYGFNRATITFDEQKEFKDNIALMYHGYKKISDTASALIDEYSLNVFNYESAKKWQSALEFLANSDVITPYLLVANRYNASLPHLASMRDLSEAIIPIRDRILSGFTPEILDEVDGKEISEKLNGQFASFFSRIFNEEYKSLIAGIQPYVKNGVKLKYQQAKDMANALTSYQEEMGKYIESESAVSGYIGPCYEGIDTDWDHVKEDFDSLAKLYNEGIRSFGLLSNMDPASFISKKPEFQSFANDLSTALNATSQYKANVVKMFSNDIFDFDKKQLSDCIKKLEGCFNNYDKLTNWIRFITLIPKLEESELLPFVDSVIQAQIRPEEIVGAYRRAFYQQWIDYVVFSTPELSRFNRIQQDQAVKTFVEKDALQYDISKLQIQSELSQQRPNLDMVAGGSDVAIIRREGQKKRKQMPIRKLLAETSSLVQIIKPCFLMSPLSVSTFLEAGKISFDTIVFDEASQIFPQDAIGAIYRGKQLIVVGDSKQMPPSNFFNASTDIEDEDEDIGDITDFESILDICSSVFNTERLAWHYRSHYEQLIAFSNLNFYNNNLVTFPSSSTDRKGIGVDYYYVDGVFDRKSKTNRAEAEFIVDLVYKNIEKYPDRSLGVVAFSVAQQNLIDKLISKKREEDPSYEWFFKSDNKEPFFVKNLETVQGDERDTIIFSVAYAKDSQGRFIHNFGPLNREGGERRLNVAITRAKDNVQLVASIHYTDINLASSGARGVHLLRAYLDYAQNGEDALERAISVSSDDQFDSYFEQEVCDYLRDHGFTVDTQVGCSGYRIDLGVRLPDSSRYVLAVECDGATYHSSKNARDRDSLRQRVLENMGWKFYRIWSTDWYRNTSVEKERLLNAAREAVNIKEDVPKQGPKKESTNSKDFETVQRRFAKDVTNEFEEYYELDALRVISKFNYSFTSGIREILELEAPLSEEYLLKRIAPYFGREKVTKVVVQEFDRLMRNCRRDGIIRRNGFLYIEGESDIKLRIPGVKRDIKYISIEELADGLTTLMKQNVNVPKEELFKSLTQLLGFNRTGDAIVTRYEQALALLKRNRVVEETNDIISILP